MLTRVKLVVALGGIAVAVAGIACDPEAKPVPYTAATLSRERETCAATADCEAPFRCVGGSCRNPTTSRLGEYHWIAGEVAAQRGDLTHALASFQLALGRFDEEKVPAPPGLVCAYGAALRRKPGDPRAGEQAARLLHRCLLATPPGSHEHDGALRELAELEPLGLDPSLLARDQPVDTYLTMPPKKPTAEAIRSEVKATGPARDKGYAAWVKTLEGEGARLLAPCFEEYFAATQKASLEFPLVAKFKGRWDSEEELYVPGGTLELGPPPAGMAAEQAKALECARTALLPAAAAFAKKGAFASFTGPVTVVLSAP